MGYIAQLKDKTGEKQYPVTLTDAVVDENGVTLTAILASGIGGGGTAHKSDFNKSFSKDF